ncbi:MULTISPECIES: hypothetical protein [Pseudomonas]|nr:MULTISPECIES: hypothetical protein [Pseudomonas]MCT8950351.1 hypothetical protein [Pseudomonas iridis]
MSWMAAPDAQCPKSPENTALSPEQAKACGNAGDTQRRTVTTMIGQLKEIRSKMLSLKSRNETLKNEVSLSLKPAKGARLI